MAARDCHWTVLEYLDCSGWVGFQDWHFAVLEYLDSRILPTLLLGLQSNLTSQRSVKEKVVDLR